MRAPVRRLPATGAPRGGSRPASATAARAMPRSIRANTRPWTGLDARTGRGARGPRPGRRSPLADRRAPAPSAHLELEPGAPARLHLRAQPQPPALARSPRPATSRRCRRPAARRVPARPHADAADEQVEQAAHLPQPGRPVPAGPPPMRAIGAKAASGHGTRAARGSTRRGPRPRRRTLVVPSPTARPTTASGRTRGPRSRAARSSSTRCGRTGKSRGGAVCDHGRHRQRSPRSACGPRARTRVSRPSHRLEQAGREHRHRDHDAPQPPLARVLAHEVAVGDPVRAADLVHPAAPREVGAADQVVEDVLDGDRLGRVPTQRGVIITGRRSTSARIISNEVLPEPMTIEALSSMVGTPARAGPPTSWRLRRCSDRVPREPSPPR